MQKFATAFILLAPALAMAHASNDLSHGHSHYFFSWHHFLGLAFLGVIGALLIWQFTRTKRDDEPREARVKVRKK